jgi:hypothetical protein
VDGAPLILTGELDFTLALQEPENDVLSLQFNPSLIGVASLALSYTCFGHTSTAPPR